MSKKDIPEEKLIELSKNEFQNAKREEMDVEYMGPNHRGVRCITRKLPINQRPTVEIESSLFWR